MGDMEVARHEMTVREDGKRVAVTEFLASHGKHLVVTWVTDEAYDDAGENLMPTLEHQAQEFLEETAARDGVDLNGPPPSS